MERFSFYFQVSDEKEPLLSEDKKVNYMLRKLEIDAYNLAEWETLI